MRNSRQYLPSISQQIISQDNSISIYNDKLTAKHAGREVVRLRNSFPALAPEFTDILLGRIIEKGFTDQQLTDAINNLIDNFTYPTPTMANILSWDKRIKLFSYNEVAKKVTEEGANFSDFKKIHRNGKLYWVLKTDYEQFNLKE